MNILDKILLLIIGEDISSEELKLFIDTNVVHDIRLKQISYKIINQEKLTENQNVIFYNKTNEINYLILRIINKKAKKL